MNIRAVILAAVFWAVLPGEILAKLCFEKKPPEKKPPKYATSSKKFTDEKPIITFFLSISTSVIIIVPFFTTEIVARVSSDCSLLNEHSLISVPREKLYYLAYARYEVMRDSAKRTGEHFRIFAEIFGCTKDRDRFSALVAKNFDYIFDEKLPNLGYVSRTEEVIRQNSELSCEETRYGRPEFLGEQQFFVMSASSAPFFSGTYSEGTLFPGAAAKPAAADSASAEIYTGYLKNKSGLYQTQNIGGK